MLLNATTNKIIPVKRESQDGAQVDTSADEDNGVKTLGTEVPKTKPDLHAEYVLITLLMIYSKFCIMCYLFIHLLFIYLFTYSIVYFYYLFIYLFNHLFVLFIYLFIYVFIYLFIYILYICLSICACASIIFHVIKRTSLCLTIYLYVRKTFLFFIHLIF